MIYRFLFLLLLMLVPVSSVTAQEYLPAYERNPNHNIRSGTELVLVYFGSSTCGPCQLEEFKVALDKAKILVSEKAKAEGKAFLALGVAVDHSVEDGLEFLSKSGRFDELAVGRNWFNSAVLTHLYRKDGARLVDGLPSVFVFERDMAFQGAEITASEPRYRAEVRGGLALPEWVEAGAPLK